MENGKITAESIDVDSIATVVLNADHTFSGTVNATQVTAPDYY
jgi:hypothetical protein